MDCVVSSTIPPRGTVVRRNFISIFSGNQRHLLCLQCCLLVLLTKTRLKKPGATGRRRVGLPSLGPSSALLLWSFSSFGPFILLVL